MKSSVGIEWFFLQKKQGLESQTYVPKVVKAPGNLHQIRRQILKKLLVRMRNEVARVNSGNQLGRKVSI